MFRQAGRQADRQAGRQAGKAGKADEMLTVYKILKI